MRSRLKIKTCLKAGNTQQTRNNFSKKNALVLGALLRSILCETARSAEVFEQVAQQRNKAFYEEKFTGEGT